MNKRKGVVFTLLAAMLIVGCSKEGEAPKGNIVINETKGEARGEAVVKQVTSKAPSAKQVEIPEFGYLIDEGYVKNEQVDKYIPSNIDGLASNFVDYLYVKDGSAHLVSVVSGSDTKYGEAKQGYVPYLIGTAGEVILRKPGTDEYQVLNGTDEYEVKGVGNIILSKGYIQVGVKNNKVVRYSDFDQTYTNVPVVKDGKEITPELIIGGESVNPYVYLIKYEGVLYAIKTSSLQLDELEIGEHNKTLFTDVDTVLQRVDRQFGNLIAYIGKNGQIRMVNPIKNALVFNVNKPNGVALNKDTNTLIFFNPDKPVVYFDNPNNAYRFMLSNKELFPVTKSAGDSLMLDAFGVRKYNNNKKDSGHILYSEPL